MPETEVYFFSDDKGKCPFLVWLDSLSIKVRQKVLLKLERLEEMGHELRRPTADYLRGGIYELRIKEQSVNYRVLYFFHSKIAVISHGIRKEGTVPLKEITLSSERKDLYARNPELHTYNEEEHYDEG